VARLGSFPQGWLRFVAGFIFGGLGGVVLFLSFNPQGQVAMIGASGAVYALVGLLLGIRLVEAFEPVPLRLLPNAFLSFIDNNRLFLLILLVGGVLAAVPSRVAWEAHLGGFMLGLCLGPWLLPPLEDSHALRAR
jgi:membrane associated rhomboid family serine protease